MPAPRHQVLTAKEHLLAVPEHMAPCHSPVAPPIIEPRLIPTPVPKLPVFTVAVILSLMGGAGLVLFFFEPGRYSFYPRCALHQATGWLCPGCGSLRALHQLLHGNVVAALHLNVLFVFSLLPFLGLGARSVARKLGGQPDSLVLRPALLWGALAILLLFGILRNLPFAHSAWLAP